MDIFIDNKNLKTIYGVEVLDYSGALSFPSERENEMEWADKSGVDKNLTNIRYNSKEFVLSCVVKATNEGVAFNLVKTLVDYMFQKGCFVLSLRDTARGIRECFLCQRSSTIIGDINIRTQNSLYYFKLGLKDVNPNAVKYKTTVAAGTVSISYTKGKTAVLYWGQGSREEITNSGTYSKSIDDNGLIDIIVDVDTDNLDAIPALVCGFTGDVLTGEKPLTVHFTDTSSGGVVIWAWNFGDGSTSDLQNPSHIYATSGTFTVTLQVFNTFQGSAILTRTAYITVTDAYLMLDGTEYTLLSDNVNNRILIN